jgi:hypothetical protein
MGEMMRLALIMVQVKEMRCQWEPRLADLTAPS